MVSSGRTSIFRPGQTSLPLAVRRMKEIIYVQVGKLSNYTGTHFWNTQESYLSSDEHGDLVDSEASFCESVDEQGRPTLCPRVLIIDNKSGFGSLSSSNALGEILETDGLDHSTWAGSIVEHREQPIPKSVYHAQLESELQQSEEPPADIRYWSDYSRVYFHPRSLHKLPDTSGFGHWDWQEWHQVFLRLNEEVELIDGSLRLLAEDCDNMQGIQISNDMTTFGSFTNSFLTCFRDEYGKLPSLTFSMPTLGFQDTAPVDDKESRALISEALYFRNLNELSSMNIPVQEPSLWPSSVWDTPLYWPSESIYHQSALLSSHVESSTLPFRLSHTLGQRDMASTFDHLKRNNNSSFGDLSGAFPLDSHFKGETIVNFSSCKIEKSPEARIDVIRGFSKKMTEDYQLWSSKNVSTRLRCTDSIHTPAFPLPSSFPPFVQTESRVGVNSPESTPMLSSLSSTSTTTARRFQRYATFVDTCIKRKPYLSLSMGFGIDETRELANDLWSICDNLGDIDSV